MTLNEIEKSLEKIMFELPVNDYRVYHEDIVTGEKRLTLRGTTIKQFICQSITSLLEEMRMEKNFELGCRGDKTCQFHYRNSTINEINKHLDNLLSKGEVK